MNKKETLIKDIYLLAKEKVAMPEILDFSLKKGEELAELYKADKELVRISICLMDIKLKEAKQQGKIGEHVAMAVEFAKDFLKDYSLTEEEFDKIINAVEAHHGKIPFKYKEAEIVCNADCYIFIHPMGVFQYAGLLAKRGENIKQQVEQLKGKLEEKYSLLTLDGAKEDLDEYYQMFKKIYQEIINNVSSIKGDGLDGIRC